jgi:two-component system nitrate/nitrite response regulator NarL
MEAALRIVLRHRTYLPAEFVLAEESARPRDGDELPSDDLAEFIVAELSPRQRQVLSLAVQGLPTKLISRRLDIAEGTVKVHLSMVYKALGVRNRTDALCRVFRARAADALGLC